MSGVSPRSPKWQRQQHPAIPWESQWIDRGNSLFPFAYAYEVQIVVNPAPELLVPVELPYVLVRLSSLPLSQVEYFGPVFQGNEGNFRLTYRVGGETSGSRTIVSLFLPDRFGTPLEPFRRDFTFQTQGTEYFNYAQSNFQAENEWFVGSGDFLVSNVYPRPLNWAVDNGLLSAG